LKDFAYRIPVGVSSFVLAGLLTAGITFITITVRTLKAATESPEALRSEYAEHPGN